MLIQDLSLSVSLSLSSQNENKQNTFEKKNQNNCSRKTSHWGLCFPKVSPSGLSVLGAAHVTDWKTKVPNRRFPFGGHIADVWQSGRLGTQQRFPTVRSLPHPCLLWPGHNVSVL